MQVIETLRRRHSEVMYICTVALHRSSNYGPTCRDTVRVGLLEMRARELFAAKLAASSFIGTPYITPLICAPQNLFSSTDTCMLLEPYQKAVDSLPEGEKSKVTDADRAMLRDAQGGHVSI